MRMTSVRCAVAAAAMIGAALGGAAAQENQEDKGNQIMALTRKALGGEQKLAAVRSLSLRANYQREMSIPGMTGGGRATVMVNGGPPSHAGGDSPQVTGEIEVDLELPDKYIKVDTSTGFMAMTRTEGFEGERAFAHAAAANPGMRIQIDRPGDDPARMKLALQRNRAELARLLLGILGSTPASLPATYTHAGVAESADGKADIIDVKGPDGFAVRLYVDVQTHLPLMLSYMAPEARVIVNRADRDTADAAGDRERIERERQQEAATPPKLVEYRVFFSDYRDVGSLTLPHRIARGTAQKTTEEWEVRSYRINPSLKADRFKVS